MSIEVTTNIIDNLINLLKTGKILGNISPQAKEKLWLVDEGGVSHGVTYSEYFGIPKKDPTKIRNLLNQGKSQIIDGIVNPNINPNIIHKYAEMDAVTE